MAKYQVHVMIGDNGEVNGIVTVEADSPADAAAEAVELVKESAIDTLVLDGEGI